MVFEQLYKDYWDKVYRLCMGYVNDHDWAKDIAQDTFIIVWQQLPNFRNESAIGTWIFRIACNNCLRQMERNKRITINDLPMQLEDKASAVGQEEVDYLYKCIAALHETDRLIISMELEDIKQSEIAGILGMTESNIRVRIHRIKEKLMKKFRLYEH